MSFPRIVFFGLVLILTMVPVRSAETSVVLITVDTLRADRTAPYGYRKAETPALDRLAADGIVFENAIVQTPITLPSHASIFTSTYPMFHRLQDVVGRLRTDIPTLAEWFRERGYRTGAFVGASVLSADWGLDRGFDRYDDEFTAPAGAGPVDFDRVERSAERVVGRALTWLEGNGDRPFFLWVHLYDPHDPYAPPEPFASRFKDRPYDGEIAYTDSQIGRLFADLKSKRRYDPSLIVLTADHGESLWEHGEEHHGFFIYEASLRVPLIFKPPGGRVGPKSLAGSRVANQVRSIDIAPSIAQILGAQVPDWMQGVGLTAHMLGRRGGVDLPAYAESHYPRVHFGWSPLFSLSTGRHKYIEAPLPELYDLKSDGRELANLIDKNRALANGLREELKTLQARYGDRSRKGGDRPADPQALERLKSLGYVTFSAGTVDENVWGDLPDPKLKIEIYNQLNQAIRLTRLGNGPQAIQALQKVVVQEPEMPIIHFLLGSEYAKAGLHLKAIEEFKDTIRYNPGSDVARFNLARAYAASGLRSKAVETARELIRLEPAHYGSRLFLARLLARAGDFEGAIREVGEVVALRPDLADAYNALGAYQFSAGHLEDASASYGKAIEVAPGYPEARINLALTYLRLKRFDQALSEARRAVGMAPQAALAHYYMGQAYLAKGMKSQAKSAFEKAHTLNPKLQIPSL